MKKIGLFMLSVLFAIAVYGQCIDFILKTFTKHHVSLNENIYCEEGNQDGKKSYGEDDNDDLSDKLFNSDETLIVVSESIPSVFLKTDNFYSSEYFKIIYSPPEFS